MNASRQFLLAAALAAAAIVFVYSNSLHNAFHFDDSHVIVNNVYIRSLSHVPLFFRDAHTFSTRADHATYRPLVTLTYALDCAIAYAVAGSLNPVAFHVTQIVLLLTIWAMLVVFFRKALDVVRPSPRNGWIALAAATLWSIHTVNTETMNLISARSEELSAIASLAAFLLIQFSPRSRRWHLYLIPIAIGALAKAQIVIFAPLLLVYLVFIEGRSIRKRATWAAIMPSVVAGVVLLFVLNRMNAPEWIPGGNSKWHYVITQGFAWTHYTRLFFVPVGLTADTDWKTFENWYDPRALAGSLPLAQRQIVEITAAFMREPRILFLDEPTSALAEHDVAWLFGLVRELRDAGAAILFTSHRWNEVASLADRITILRNGEHVATRERFDEDEAVTLMTGRTIDRMYPDKPAPAGDADVVLEAEELRDDVLDGVSFKLRRGEILGVGGLAGQGQGELFMSLFGARRTSRGQISVRGRRARLRKPADAIRKGLAIALVPEDRKTEGLMLPMSVRDNLTLAVLEKVARGGVIRPWREKATVAKAVERLGIKTRDAALQPVGTLSGGNQQKVLLGKWLETDPRVLMLDEPTRGVDVGAKAEIYQLLGRLADQGIGVLLASSELAELVGVCDRVIVLRGGRSVAELATAQAGEAELLAASMGEVVQL